MKGRQLLLVAVDLLAQLVGLEALLSLPENILEVFSMIESSGLADGQAVLVADATSYGRITCKP